jgi:hypothetical protein
MEMKPMLWWVGGFHYSFGDVISPMVDDVVQEINPISYLMEGDPLMCDKRVDNNS